MKRSTHIKGLLLVAFFSMLHIVHAQDLRFSQYFNSPLSTNPANTGFLPSSDYRLGAHYREQWASVPVPYKTMSVYGDFQFMRNLIPSGWMGLDCGPQSNALFKQVILASKMILWNG